MANQEAEKAEIYSQAMLIANSASLPMVLRTAVKLNLFEIIAKAGNGKKLSPAQIASKLPTKNPGAASMLDRVLLLLTTHSLLTCDVLGDVNERVYGLSPVGEFFVPDEEGNTIANLAEMQLDKVKIDGWYKLETAILEGGESAFYRTHGANIWEVEREDARFNKVFNKGLAGVTSTTMKLVLSEYKGFEGLCTLVDVGGGLGASLQKILSVYPSIKGINFDLPYVVDHAPPYPGLEHIGGDMFKSVPEADAIFMKGVLHDWGDGDCIRILKNCYKALPSNGKVIVAEMIRPEKPDTSYNSKIVSYVDTLMMMVTNGGKERSEAEFQALGLAAGFKGIKSYSHVNVGLIEYYK